MSGTTSFTRSPNGAKDGRMGYGISAAIGLPELRIATGDHGRLDNSRDSLDQQFLQTAGPKCDSVHGAAATGQRNADCSFELLAINASRNSDDADSEH